MSVFTMVRSNKTFLVTFIYRYLYSKSFNSNETNIAYVVWVNLRQNSSMRVRFFLKERFFITSLNCCRLKFLFWKKSSFFDSFSIHFLAKKRKIIWKKIERSRFTWSNNRIKTFLRVNFQLRLFYNCQHFTKLPTFTKWYNLSGNTKGGSITVLLTSCLTGLESAVWQLTIFAFICKTD